MQRGQAGRSSLLFGAEEQAAQASSAFTAAAIASQATAAVLGAVSSAQHIAKLTAADSQLCDAIAAVHRLNERFAACATYEEAMRLAGELSQPTTCGALVRLLSEGDVLVELAVQLLQSLCLHETGARAIERAGARANE